MLEFQAKYNIYGTYWVYKTALCVAGAAQLYLSTSQGDKSQFSTQP